MRLIISVIIFHLFLPYLQAKDPLVCYVGSPDNYSLKQCRPNIVQRRQRDLNGGQKIIVSSKLPISQNFTEQRLLSNITVIGHNDSLVKPTAPINSSTELPSTIKKDADSKPPSLTNISTYYCSVFIPKSINKALKFEHPTDFGCDDGTFCSGVKNFSVVHDVTYHGNTYNIICCEDSKCNSPETVHNIVHENSKFISSCYTDDLSPTHCFGKSIGCANLTKTNSNGSYSMYRCDLESESLCLKFNITTDSCRKVSISSNETTNLCCCFSNNCNYIKNDESPNLSVIALNATAAPFGPLRMLNDLRWVGYGWGGCLIIGLLVMMVFFVVRRRKKSPTIALVSDLRYQRLTANFSAGDTEDVQMLLGENEN